MVDLLIRDLPPSTHAELKRRADDAGMSLQAYVTHVLERTTATPSLDAWLRALEDLTPHRTVSGAEVVESARRELP